MTKKRFTILYGIDENPFEWDIMDNEKDALICQCNGKPICDLLNELNDENKQLKKILNKLSNMLQFDVENGIRSYPVKLSEYLSNALKELQRND